MSEYISLAISFCVAFCIAGLMNIMPSILFKYKRKNATSSHYECGFSPVSLPSKIFGVTYFRIAIMFVVFDSEIFLFVPGIISKSFPTLMSCVIVTFVAFILLLGFGYEIHKGTLQW